MKKKLILLYPREGSFAGLDSLEWLKLEDNAISALSGGDLFPASLKVTCQQLALWKEITCHGHFVYKSIFINNNKLLLIQGIEIHNNPWLCDCRLLEFSRYFQIWAQLFFKPGSNLAHFLSQTQTQLFSNLVSTISNRGLNFVKIGLTCSTLGLIFFLKQRLNFFQT